MRHGLRLLFTLALFSSPAVVSAGNSVSICGTIGSGSGGCVGLTPFDEVEGPRTIYIQNPPAVILPGPIQAVGDTSTCVVTCGSITFTTTLINVIEIVECPPRDLGCWVLEETI